MNISIDGKIPEITTVEALFKQIPIRFELGKFSEYEENIQWEHMIIEYQDGTQLHCEGYTGLWELTALERQWNVMNDETKMSILSGLWEWMEWLYDDDDVYLFEF